MLTLWDLFEIACRYATAMADAMALACVDKAGEAGVTLGDARQAGDRRGGPPSRGARPAEGTEWERMVRGNSDTRWQHV